MLCKFGFLSKLLLSVDSKEYQGILGVRDLFGLASASHSVLVISDGAAAMYWHTLLHRVLLIGSPEGFYIY